MADQQNGYHANIQDSHMLHLMIECMKFSVEDCEKGVKQGDYERINRALTQLRGFARTAENEAKSMVEGSRKEESLQPLQGVEFRHE